MPASVMLCNPSPPPGCSCVSGYTPRCVSGPRPFRCEACRCHDARPDGDLWTRDRTGSRHRGVHGGPAAARDSADAGCSHGGPARALAQPLALRFPQVAVIHDDAARIRHVTPFGSEATDLVICGLPLLSMPAAKVLRIVAGCMRVLKPEGELRLFTYGQRCPIPAEMLSRLGLVAQRRTFVPLNMPPASVSAVVRREQSA